jgi:hypothetical protein
MGSGRGEIMSARGLRFEIENIELIESFPAYNKMMEYSDKIIVPKYIYDGLVKNSLNLPAVFLLSVCSKPVFLCGALEYAAETASIYCPRFLYSKVVEYLPLHVNSEAILEVIYPARQQYAFTQLKRVEISTEQYLSYNTCKTALLRFTVIKAKQRFTVR